MRRRLAGLALGLWLCAVPARAGNGIASIEVRTQSNLTSIAVQAIVHGDDDSSAVLRIFQRRVGAAAYDTGMVMVRRVGFGPTTGDVRADNARAGNVYEGRILWLEPGDRVEFYVEGRDAGGDFTTRSTIVEPATIRQLDASGPVFYVSAGAGDDRNDGARTHPKRTINAALDALSASPGHGRHGGIFVAPGEYHERLDFDARHFPEDGGPGFIEGDGKFYRQPRTEIRPRPQYSFDSRIYAVASSEDSIDSAAKLGAHIVMFADRPWEMRLPAIERGRALHRKYHGTEPPQVMLTEFCVCGTNLTETEEEARRYQGKFVESNFYHYEFLGEHFKTVKGYDAYQQKAEIARKGGLDGAVAGFMQAASWGTPDKILRGLEKRREIIGNFELNVAFRFGGTPYEIAERGLKLFAKEVLPVLKAQSSTKVREAAE